MNNEITKSTFYMVRILLFSSLLTFLASTGYAQRDYFYRDSTIYQISPTIQYIAGKRTLYKNEANGITPIKDFTVTNDTTFYIRDVDFVNDRKGYVLVGSMYIGNLTQLYKTEDGGLNWELDTSFYAASQRKSINQMQVLDSNTFVLFDGYYTSSLIRSFDGGKTWTKWFESLIAHYFQLHKCSNGTFYLIGLPGDGFSSYSFPIPDSLWNKNNTNFMSGCHNSAPGCIRVYRDGDRDRATDFIAKQIDTLSAVCGNVTSVRNPFLTERLTYFPNPASQYLTINSKPFTSYEIFDSQGRVLLRGTITSDHETILLNEIPPGYYLLKINNSFNRLIKQ